MSLRVSGQMSGLNVNVESAVNVETESGVPHGKILITLAETVLGKDEAALESARAAVLEAMEPAALVDAAAIVATFMHMVRLADGTGLPLDIEADIGSQRVQTELGLNTFSSSRNTPQATWKRLVGQLVALIPFKIIWALARATRP